MPRKKPPIQHQSKHSGIQNCLGNIQEIDSALLHHEKWLKDIHRSLICDGNPNPDDLQEDGHCLCKFGQWYYKQNQGGLGSNVRFQKLENLHKLMHDKVRNLLVSKTAQSPISMGAYNAFMDNAIHFKLETRKLQFELIEKVCTVDQLTGTWNRHAMSYKLAQELERSIRTKEPCSICLMDIDHFKKINDQFGHQAGDLVLKTISQFFTDRLRKYDTIFRYGGEEFLLNFPGTTEEQLEVTINRLRTELQALPISMPDGSIIHVTASFGIADMVSDIGIEESIEHADHALLCAKASGRNCVCVWKT
ncbi:diguanylate cyclase [Sulfurirhabdus autotrophica]|uniref:diguanylate cyclase n=1 Tax=Sulfurirhabdus autotrophica TaxID=1706046 RepID=A0A4R3Y0H2_9PROT|nr:diguanylate cyclase [Sulfurirhabdus autotrophica]TCV85156.1 diguanylate cyclase (GGDEF)-like protein [Sulfurirhabdus autotrophica]